jgi:hypothetical protein
MVGWLDAVERRVGTGGEVVVTLSGQTRARELVLPTVVSYTATGASLASVVSALITPHGWTLGECPTGYTLTATLRGVSPWLALTQIAERLGLHLREDPLRRVVDVVSAPVPSGLRYSMAAPPLPDERASHVPILGATVSVDLEAVWTRVIPLAEPVAGRTARLEDSTRSSPYAIQSAVAEDGSTYYYIESASAATYGVRAVLQTWRGIAPLDDTSGEAVRAANDLYDAAAAWLRAHDTPPLRLRIEPAPTYHLDTGGAYRLMPGQTVDVSVGAAVVGASGQRTPVVEVAGQLYVLEIVRRFSGDGADQWRLLTSDVPVPPADDIDQLAQALSVVQTVQMGAGSVSGGTGGAPAGSRTIWDTVIEATLRGQHGTPWW